MKNLNAGYSISKHMHTKHDFQFWIVELAHKVQRMEYLNILDTAKAVGGWYSRKWGESPAGFGFKELKQAQEFADKLVLINLTPEKSVQAAKFRWMADKMQGGIDKKLADKLTNTPKRQRDAAYSRHGGNHLKRVQEALRAMAGHLDAGTLPRALAGLKSINDVSPLMRSNIDRSNAGYYDAGVDTNQPAEDPTAAALALWAMIKTKTKAEIRADIVRDKIESLKFSKIDGYFPTPQTIVDLMIEVACIPLTSSFNILDPSAGHGSILDAVRAYAPSSILSAYEINYRLREILELKNYDIVDHDFMECASMANYDRILLNPPFEKNQDIDHVRRAHAMLAPNGRLVGIMAPGAFFRSDRKASEFREWFEHSGGEKIDLPEESFKDSGTNINTVMVIIDND